MLSRARLISGWLPVVLVSMLIGCGSPPGGTDEQANLSTSAPAEDSTSTQAVPEQDSDPPAAQPAAVEENNAVQQNEAVARGGENASEDKPEQTQPVSEAKQQLPENPFPRRVKAPPLEGGVGWLNTSTQLTLRDLRGKIVLLDFWTYCCINCMHILPELKRLEQKYRDELVVIGVHSAKFETEKESQNIREAIVRYEIEHPVVNDAHMLIWRRYGARAWPTLVLIDPEGYAVLMLSGEGWFDVIEQAIEKLIAYHSAKGTLKRGRLHFALERDKLPPTPLRFPGKVWVDEPTKRLFIADSNHNRIVISTLDGELLEIIGDGAIGLKDGPFEQARFFRPQGLTLVGDQLFVADTENHVIRVCDLKERTVRTVAGTGKQGWLRPFEPRPARTTPLSSPWDVCWVNGRLLIAMAGLHQIWVYDPEQQTVRVFSGSGREGIVDGPPADAQYAQPSGLSTDGRRVFVADAETSSVRVLDPATGNVTTVVGVGLFDFGDRDGVGDEVRLQHPLHVAYWKDDLVFIADTYNNKIKLLDVAERRCRTWLGGPAGRTDDPPRFDEPGGLAVAGGKLYVADTNNHLIRVIDLASRSVRTLEIKGLKPPTPPRSPEEWLAGAEVVKVDPQRWPASGTVRLRVQLELPDEIKLNEQAPMAYAVRAVNGGKKLVSVSGKAMRVNPPQPTFDIDLRIQDATGAGTLQVRVDYYPCRKDDSGACYVASVVWEIPFEVARQSDGKAELTLQHAFQLP